MKEATSSFYSLRSTHHFHHRRETKSASFVTTGVILEVHLWPKPPENNTKIDDTVLVTAAIKRVDCKVLLYHKNFIKIDLRTVW